MTDRYHSITVVLEKDMRDDDVRAILEAIKQFRGVLTATGVVADLGSMMAEERARHVRDYFVQRGVLVRPGWKPVALCGWLAVGVLLLLLVSKMNYSIQVELENIHLKRALELFTRAEGSCTVMNNGPRVICVMKEGQVSRRDMEYTEQIVWRPNGRRPRGNVSARSTEKVAGH